MKSREKMILEYVAKDGTVFSDPELCKEYEAYLKSPKVFLIEVVHIQDKKHFTFPQLLYVCKTFGDAKKKVKQMDFHAYKDINIIERLLEKV